MGNCPPEPLGIIFTPDSYILNTRCFFSIPALLGLPPSLCISENIPHCYNSTSPQACLNDDITYAVPWEELPTQKSPRSPQTLPDDCVLLAESLPAFELLESADYLLPCQPVAHCFLVSLHLLFVLCLGMSVLPSAVCQEERLPNQAAWRRLPAGGKALCSAIVAPFLEPAHLDLHHSTVHETLEHKLSVLQWECT